MTDCLQPAWFLELLARASASGLFTKCSVFASKRILKSLQSCINLHFEEGDLKVVVLLYLFQIHHICMYSFCASLLPRLALQNWSVTSFLCPWGFFPLLFSNGSSWFFCARKLRRIIFCGTMLLVSSFQSWVLMNSLVLCLCASTSAVLLLCWIFP